MSKPVPGTIRTFLGLGLLFLAGSVSDTLPDPEFFLWSLAFGIPGAILGISGVSAMHRAGVV